MSAAHDLQADAAQLIGRIASPVEVWTPALRAALEAAPTVVVELEGRGRVSARILREREHGVRVHPGKKGLLTHAVVLVAIEGEEVPRWIDASRVVLRSASDSTTPEGS